MNTDFIQKIADQFGLNCNKQVIEWLLKTDAVVAFAVSGGKDSVAQTLRGVEFLRKIYFDGDIVLIHSDLGEIEHAESLPKCRELAEKVGCELIVVKPARTMLEIFEARWFRNVERYKPLSCVTLITPWSSASMRFCTKEAKVAPITKELVRRFPNKSIINAVGIRAEESDSRANKPVCEINKDLQRKKLNTVGLNWYPIHGLTAVEVFLTIKNYGLSPHQCYSRGNTRCSCSCCVLSGLSDLLASLTDERNHYAYIRLCTLEAESGFSFQPSRWLADVRPDILSPELLDRIKEAKARAVRRRLIEKTIPKGLLYCKGFPRYVPELGEAQILADARAQIAELYGWQIKFTTAISVRARYQQLYDDKLRREAKSQKKKEREIA